MGENLPIDYVIWAERQGTNDFFAIVGLFWHVGARRKGPNKCILQEIVLNLRGLGVRAEFPNFFVLLKMCLVLKKLRKFTL